MTNLDDELIAIARELEILSAASFRFRGELIPVGPASEPTPPGLPAHPLPQIPLVRDLQAVLYARCYSRRIEDPAPAPDAISPDPTFLPKLIAGNQSRAGWEGGWTIYQVAANSQIWVSKGDRQRSALPGEFISHSAPGMLPQAGAIVTLQVLRDSTIAQPGFYYAYGETLGDVWDDQNVVRFYFHAPSTAAPDLLQALTLRLNRYQVPFRLKALSEPGLYGRADAVVLYVARRYHTITVRIVRDLPRHVTDQLRPSTPLFTLALQPGVGIAEDPNTGESFGMHRCRLVAEAIVDAWQRGDQSPEGRVRAVEARFSQSGIRLDAPYLSPTSTNFASIPEQVDFAYA